MIVFFGAMASASGVMASVSGPGSVTRLIADSSGYVYFYHSGQTSTRPSCAPANRWVINTNDRGGAALLSTFVTTFANNKTVTVEGSGSCPTEIDGELPYFIVVDK